MDDMFRIIATLLTTDQGVSAPQYETPSYSNTGGTGNRTATISVTTNFTTVIGDINKLVDGIIPGGAADEGVFIGQEAVDGKYIQFAFAHAVLITEATYYRGSAGGGWNFINLCTCKWRGSNNGTTWTDIGSTFDPTFDTVQVFTSLGSNTNGYAFYQLYFVSGNPTYYEPPVEMEFKIGNPL